MTTSEAFPERPVRGLTIRGLTIEPIEDRQLCFVREALYRLAWPFRDLDGRLRERPLQWGLKGERKSGKR